MAVTEVSIANRALSRVGTNNVLSVLDGSGTEANRQCYLHYEPCRDALLRAHPWNFALKRSKLITGAESAKTITGATQADPVVITAASHGYSDGDRVRIADVGGMTAVNGREFTIDVLTSNTFSLLDEDGSSYGAYTSGGTATKIPASGFSYWFALPSDCLRLLWVDQDAYEYKVEGGRILANSDTVDVRYIYKVTDPALFDPYFAECLVVSLAIAISVKLSDNANLKESLKADLRDLLRDARAFDAQEGGTPDPIDIDTWNRARF